MKDAAQADATSGERAQASTARTISNAATVGVVTEPPHPHNLALSLALSLFHRPSTTQLRT